MLIGYVIPLKVLIHVGKPVDENSGVI